MLPSGIEKRKEEPSLFFKRKDPRSTPSRTSPTVPFPTYKTLQTAKAAITLECQTNHRATCHRYTSFHKSGRRSWNSSGNPGIRFGL
jgi:hypothetical protein